MELVGTGLSGLVGSRFAHLYASTYSFTNLDLSVGVDITKQDTVFRAVEQSSSPVIIHMAAFTNATKAWEQTGDKNGSCYQVNVDGTRNIAQAAKKFGKHLVHISTAFVFDGKKETMYVEDDLVSPIEWYGQTKAQAEEVVQEECKSWTIFRIDQPFRSDSFPKKDTAHKMIEKLQLGKFTPFGDHWFAPTIIEDFSKVLDWAVKTKPQGIFHATCHQKISDYEYAQMIDSALNLKANITPGSLQKYLKTQSRPYQVNTALNSKKLIEESLLSFMPLEQAIKMLQT